MLTNIKKATINKTLVEDEQVNIYFCGPTIYDELHVGNLRPIVVFDSVKNALEFLGYKVKLVTNITDVDDKIINKCIAENASFETIIDRYYDAYAKLLEMSNVTNFNIIRVTEEMDGIIDYVSQLIEKGFAYEVDGSVYFRVNKVAKYGEVSNNKVDEDLIASESDFAKEDPSDFAIWKKTSDNVKQWNAPFSNGRPGWHTECSYFINKVFGDQATIHGGGMDLKFPHHENENAQNYALRQCGIAKIWMHTGMVNINNEKMSKSIGNIVLARELIEQYSIEVMRLFLLKNHYAKPVNLIENEISELTKLINSLNSFNSYAQIYLKETNELDQEVMDKVTKHFQNDMNFANVISELQMLTKRINKEILSENANILINTLNTIYGILGIKTNINLTTEEIVKIKNEDYSDLEYQIVKNRWGIIALKGDK